MQELIMENIGAILAMTILGALLASLIPWIIREIRETHELKRIARCGPGCICGGENVQARRPISAQAPQPMMIYQPQPQAPMIIQQPTPQIIYLQAPTPQVVYQPQPQPIYIQAPPQQHQARQIPAPQSAAPHPWQHPDHPPQTHVPQRHDQQPTSYYPGYAPEPEDYQPEVRYLPPSQPVGQFPPPRASAIDEARRAFEKEREMERRR